MPLNTVQCHLKSVLENLPLPRDLGLLDAFIAPVNPNTETQPPGCYIWGSNGNESRMARPRAQPGVLTSGGNKELVHQVDVWLIWFGDPTEADADTAFPSVIDAVMACLRNTMLLDAVTIHAVDPITGQQSDLLTIGENMSWEYAPVRATADQRYLRYDALITCEVVEVIQA